MQEIQLILSLFIFALFLVPFSLKTSFKEVKVSNTSPTSNNLTVHMGQWLAGPSFNQRVGGSIPALVDVSLSKTLNPELLPVAASTVYVTGL